jgi:putative ABC transport system ATP-binding protein
MFLLENVKYKNILNISKLKIEKYKITSILGESGSGKTTLLRLLNKLSSYDSGEIYYNDTLLRNINSVTLRRNVVMLPQSPPIFEGTIKDNLLIGLTFSEKPIASDDSLHEVMKLIHLNKSLSDNANKLSGGEKQRLALGRVLLLNADVFLLDEPSSSLDEETEYIIINSLVTYCKSNNKTLIIVTHSKKIATTFSDYIVNMKNGQVIDIEEVK